MTSATADFLLIGGGVIGLNLAIEVRRRHPDATVTLIEKEPDFGLHASGRNSGVIHAGFYYTAESLKARFTRDGNREMTAFCREHGIPLNTCGKLVVARDPEEDPVLDELLARARANGVELHEVPEAEALRIEPRARVRGRALFAPTTASVDPRQVMEVLVTATRDAGVTLRPGTRYLGRAPDGVRTSAGTIRAGYVINAAGLYADRVARDYGFSADYTILPFKGIYLYAEGDPAPIRTHVYPVPDLKNPFLGVHYTVTVDGKVKIGPTAIPAFWREHYQGLANFSLREFAEIAGLELSLLARNDFGFRSLARSELAKHSRRRMVAEAGRLVRDVQRDHYRTWGTPGIRAQLFDLKHRRLEMDFRYEGDRKSFHVLNAVSPAFTCSMPFARHVADRIEERLAV